MLKKRFGEDFFSKIQENLEVKGVEQAVRREAKGRRRGDQKREGRGTRQPRERGERGDRGDRAERRGDRGDREERK